MITFYHLPKTGGRGICEWLQTELGVDFLRLRAGNEDIARDIFIRRSRVVLEAFKAIGGHDAMELPNRIAYTALREPTERLWSQHQHLLRADKASSPDFDIWLKQGFCTCLWCTYQTPRAHPNDPICWFYASRVGGKRPKSPLEQAAEVLSRTVVYDVDETEFLVQDVAEVLDINPYTYKPVDITGSGAEVPEWARELVRERDKLDMELWRRISE